MPQHAVPPQYMTPQRNLAHQNDAALRRSRKPTDKNIPDGVEEVVVGEGVQQYKSLRDLEKRLDAAVVRKRLDIQDSISKTVKKYRTMRIWVSNTVEGQPWQNSSGQNGVPASTPGSGRYKVRIEGRLLDDVNDLEASASDDEGDAQENGDTMEEDGADAKKPASKRSKQRFSQFFKSITVDFDKSSATSPDEMKTINWAKPQLPPNAASLPPTADFDSVQFSRASQENLNVTISLVRDETPERYKLSKELAEVLDVEEETRSGIVLGVWDYIRAMGLQEDEEKRLVRCDDRLRAVGLPHSFSHFGTSNKVYRFSAETRCSSPRFPKASVHTLAHSTPSSFLTLSASMKTSTKTPPPPSMTSKLPSKILSAQRC
jgi:SWI/SNF-related matrix-associated actin-dependent regulator of chromatin subfamily D